MPRFEQQRFGSQTDSKALLIVGSLRPSALQSQNVMLGTERQMFHAIMQAGGLNPNRVDMMSLSNSMKKPTPDDCEYVSNWLKSRDYKVLIACGNSALEFLTGKDSVDKYSGSRMEIDKPWPCKHVIPCHEPRRLVADPSMQYYLRHAFRRIADALNDIWPVPDPIRHLDPPHDFIIEYLRDHLDKTNEVGNDLETGSGQANTMGLCFKRNEAISFKVLPGEWSTAAHHELWRLINIYISDPQYGKIFQNLAHETQYYSSYGIQVRNVVHDTMYAQKFLEPEFPMGLGEVGRVYTDAVYWKDDGKKESEEGKKKDWSNIKDWPKHIFYNNDDTVHMVEAKYRQIEEMKRRGIYEAFQTLVMGNAEDIIEMITEGLPISPAAQAELAHEMDEKITHYAGLLKTEIQSRDLEKFKKTFLNTPHIKNEKRKIQIADDLLINHRSSDQKKIYLRDVCGYTLPKIFRQGKRVESTNKESIAKLKLKHPDDKVLDYFMELATFEKNNGTYVKIDYDKKRNRMNFGLNGHGTETQRFSSSQDAWRRGTNAQTIPGGHKGVNIKKMFWADLSEDHVFLQIDLEQAESRYVGYEANDRVMIKMLEDPDEDIHKYVAAGLYNLRFPPGEKSRSWLLDADKHIAKMMRQLGKKTGHAKNYDMKERKHQSVCLEELGLVLTLEQCKRNLSVYDQLFPGVAARKQKIRNEVRAKRKLKTLLGHERTFWGRMDDDLFREAYAYAPQTTIPSITNYLMRHLRKVREQGLIDYVLHLQCHDSLLMQVHKDMIRPIVDIANNLEEWHPVLDLPGGRLWIPVGVEVGKCWGSLEDWK